MGETENAMATSGDKDATEAEEDSELQEITARRGRHFFGSLDMVTHERDGPISEGIANEEASIDSLCDISKNSGPVHTEGGLHESSQHYTPDSTFSEEHSRSISMSTTHATDSTFEPGRMTPDKNANFGPKENKASDAHSVGVKFSGASSNGTDFEEDILAVYKGCLAAAGKKQCDQVNAPLTDPAHIRSALMAHGFNAKQCNAILAKMDDEEKGCKRVNIELLRSAVIPILKECDGTIESHLTKGNVGIGPRVSTSVDSAISEAQKESSSLDDSKVSVIPGADDSLLMDGGGGQSTHMDSIHLSDLPSRPNESETTFITNATPHKFPTPTVLPHGPAGQDASLIDTHDDKSEAKSGATLSESSASIEKMTKNIAEVCKKGVWQAWRGDPRGLSPIYSISLWHDTQTLMIKCGLVEVLGFLMIGIAADLLAQGRQSGGRADKKLRVRLDGSIAHNSQFSRKSIVTAQKIMGVLINLSFRQDGAECCRRVDQLRDYLNELCALPVPDVAQDAGRLLFLLDDSLHHKFCHAFSDLLVSSVSSSTLRQSVGAGRVYLSFATADEELVAEITSGLRRAGIQIVTRKPGHVNHQPSPVGGTLNQMNVGGIAIPKNGPVENINQYGVGVSGMCRSILMADIVLVILSEAYFESYSCRLEANYLAHPQCHTLPVLIDRLQNNKDGSGWECLEEGWMKKLKDKATKYLRGTKASNVRTVVSVIKGILYTCGLSNDSEWSEMNTIKKAPRARSTVGGDTLRTLNAISADDSTRTNHMADCDQNLGTLKQRDLTSSGTILPWDDNPFLYEFKSAEGVPPHGSRLARGSSHPEVIREKLSSQKGSKLQDTSHTRSDPNGVTSIRFNGGGLGHNMSLMSKFSVMRGASVGAAFDNSAERFNQHFNLSRYHYRQYKSYTCSSGGNGEAKMSENSRSQPTSPRHSLYYATLCAHHPSPKMTESFLKEQKVTLANGTAVHGALAQATHPGVRTEYVSPAPGTAPASRPASAGSVQNRVGIVRPASAGSVRNRMASARPASAGSVRDKPGIITPDKGLSGGVPSITIFLESRGSSPGAGHNPHEQWAQASTNKTMPSRPASASPSVQRWTGQPLGVGDRKGRADDVGLSARTLANFTRNPLEGPVRSFQRASYEQRPQLIRHYSATAASRILHNPTKQIGGSNAGVSNKPQQESASTIKATGGFLNLRPDKFNRFQRAPSPQQITTVHHHHHRPNMLSASWAPPKMKTSVSKETLQKTFERSLHSMLPPRCVPQLNVSKAVDQRQHEMKKMAGKKA